MIQPDFKTFPEARAARATSCPVYENYTADLLTPVGAHLRIAHEAKYSFLLESVEGGENIARYTFTGANPEEVFRARGQSAAVARSKPAGRRARTCDGDPVEQLAPARRALPSGARAGAASADCRRDRLFCVRHGAAGRATFPPAAKTNWASTIA